MRRHEMARIAEVSSSLLATLGAAVMVADWLMSFFPGFCSCGAWRGRGVLSILRGEKKREDQCPVEAVRTQRAIANDPLAQTARSGAALARCGARGLSANSLARFLRRFPLRNLRGLSGGLLRPLRRSSLHRLPSGFFDSFLLFCSLVAFLAACFAAARFLLGAGATAIGGTIMGSETRPSAASG